jgi:hypothetical protein
MFHNSALSTRTPRNVSRFGLLAAAILLAVSSAAQAGNPVITNVLAVYDNSGFVQDTPTNAVNYIPGSYSSTTLTSSLTGSLGGASFIDSVTLSPSLTAISSDLHYDWLLTLTAQAAVDSGVSPQGLAQANPGLEMFVVSFRLDQAMCVRFDTDVASVSSYPTIKPGNLIQPGTYQVVFSGAYLQGALVGAGETSTTTAHNNFGIVFTVPEPASLTVLGIGAAALLSRRRSRRA